MINHTEILKGLSKVRVEKLPNAKLKTHLRKLQRELAYWASEASSDYANISESNFDDEPGDEQIYADMLAGNLNKAAEVKGLIEDVEGVIEDRANERGNVIG